MPDPARHRSGRSITRTPIVAALAAVLVVGGLVDRIGAAHPSTPAVAAAGVPPVAVAAPDGALSSSWFCAGATEASGGEAGGTILVANVGRSRATGRVTVVDSRGRRSAVPVSVAPGTRVAVPEKIPGGLPAGTPEPFAGAIVDMDAGAVAVEQQVTGDYGTAASPCATSGSAQWYFATGETLLNASEEISLLNPYPTDAVVDLSFTTDQGFEAPADFQGLDVPAGGMISVDVRQHLRRRHAVAASVIARTGRVVAWKTQVVSPPQPGQVVLGRPGANSPLADPVAPTAGVIVALGAPAAANRLVFADGDAGGGVDERYVIYNPGTGTANLRLSVNLDHGVAEPFTLSLGPQDVTTVVSDQEARIPAGVGHSAVLVSTNHVPVVAERTVSGTPAAGYPGLGDLVGQTGPAAAWVLPTGGADPTHRGTVVVYNPGPTSARVLLQGYRGARRSELPGGGSFVVGPGRRAAIAVNGGQTEVSATPLVVEASAPVYVELTAAGHANTPGVSLSAGVPLAP